MCHISGGQIRFVWQDTCIGRTKQNWSVYTRRKSYLPRKKKKKHPHFFNSFTTVSSVSSSSDHSRDSQRHQSQLTGVLAAAWVLWSCCVPQVKTYIPLHMCVRESERRKRAREAAAEGSCLRKGLKPLQHTPTHQQTVNQARDGEHKGELRPILANTWVTYSVNEDLTSDWNTSGAHNHEKELERGSGSCDTYDIQFVTMLVSVQGMSVPYCGYPLKCNCTLCIQEKVNTDNHTCGSYCLKATVCVSFLNYSHILSSSVDAACHQTSINEFHLWNMPLWPNAEWLLVITASKGDYFSWFLVCHDKCRAQQKREKKFLHQRWHL